MIFIQNLSKSFGEKCVLSDITLTIGDGSLFGLIGCNGAGKTTLLNILSGFYTPSAGRVTVSTDEGECIPFDNPVVKRSLFYLTDDMYFMKNASMRDMRDYYAGFYPCFSDKSFTALCDLFSLSETAPLQSFSKGMKRQASLCIAMASGARTLLLDETFDGLDPDKRRTVRSLLGEYMLEKNATVVLSSHNLFELESICDTVGMLNGTRLAFHGDVEEMKSRIFGYTAIIDGTYDAHIFDGMRVRCLRQNGVSLTFVSDESEDALRARLSAGLTLRRLEARRLSLEEIFDYETEASRHDVTHIFS